MVNWHKTVKQTKLMPVFIKNVALTRNKINQKMDVVWKLCLGPQLVARNCDIQKMS